MHTGSAQIINLTKNPSQLTTCPGETAVFTCTVSEPRVQWDAQPYFTDTVSFLQLSEDVGNFERNNFGPSNGAIARLVGINPIVTVMEVQGNLINESFNVSCVPISGPGSVLTNDTATLEYIPACE